MSVRKARRVVLVRQKSKTIRDAALTPPCKSAVIDGEVVARKEDGTLISVRCQHWLFNPTPDRLLREMTTDHLGPILKGHGP